MPKTVRNKSLLILTSLVIFFVSTSTLAQTEQVEPPSQLQELFEQQ
ncbi:MAG: hypothetical protein FD167_5936, partial [bacterium]